MAQDSNYPPHEGSIKGLADEVLGLLSVLGGSKDSDRKDVMSTLRYYRGIRAHVCAVT